MWRISLNNPSHLFLNCIDCREGVAWKRVEESFASGGIL